MKVTAEHRDDSGRVRGFSLHDGRVVGFSFRDDEAFSFDVRRVDSSTVTVTFLRVTRFGARGFRNGAIILDVTAWPSHSVPSEQAAHAEGAWAVLFGNDIALASLPSAIKPILDAGEASFLALIECSYGGTLALLCSDIEVTEKSERENEIPTDP